MLAKFNNLELWALWNMANKRQRHKKNMGVKTKKITKKYTDVQIDYFGLKGEYAVARFLELDLNLSIQAEGDGGVDMVYHDITIDVKTTATNDLIFNSDGDFKSNIAFLVRPQASGEFGIWLDAMPLDPYIKSGDFRARNMNIVGWATKATFIFTADVKDYGYGKRKVLAGVKLQKPQEFITKYEPAVLT